MLLPEFRKYFLKWVSLTLSHDAQKALTVRTRRGRLRYRREMALAPFVIVPTKGAGILDAIGPSAEEISVA